MWAESAVCGLLPENVGRLAANVGLKRGALSENLVPFWLCLWAHVFLLLGRYKYLSVFVGIQSMEFLRYSYCHTCAIECCQCKAVQGLVVAGRQVAEQAKGNGFPESQPLETV